MRSRSRVVVAILWALSLVVVAEWSASGQQAPSPGIEVRFVQGDGAPGALRGTLIANVGGQWLPVSLDTRSVPDANSLVPR